MESLKLLPAAKAEIELVQLVEQDRYIFHRDKPKTTVSTISKVVIGPTKPTPKRDPELFDHSYYEDDCQIDTEEDLAAFYREYYGYD